MLVPGNFVKQFAYLKNGVEGYIARCMNFDWCSELASSVSTAEGCLDEENGNAFSTEYQHSVKNYFAPIQYIYTIENPFNNQKEILL